MATAPSTVRYSTANVANDSAAQSFAWEEGIPVNKFWDSLSFCTSRNFLRNFSAAELAALPIDAASSAPDTEKLELLLRLLETKLSHNDVNITDDDDDNKFDCWNDTCLAMASIQSELGRLDAAETTIRAMAAARRDKTNLSPLHMLADHLVKIRKFAEAEATERPVVQWMDAHPRLGKDSPQALSARRVLVRALWGLGCRHAEAEGMVREIREIVEGMGEGRFGVYQQEEGELVEELVAGLGMEV
ncbi:hypothetical protein B0T26DRAFT_714911 [Lasiosphaeria miniovina]|uniref:Uncharacterized protein n=1 Tax=Lasiosphaeria miniovina TaxID=1954250 RepID=A0AA40AB89_9PEZI|nr:uncharacterized protein B0T26DRAFT_714911 [Lasiosphaeria miniovina]KAK0712667.1 hypothetical protein B0T26DRAFT_714911 [Lasiosphaeria miniovina]